MECKCSSTKTCWACIEEEEDLDKLKKKVYDSFEDVNFIKKYSSNSKFSSSTTSSNSTTSTVFSISGRKIQCCICNTLFFFSSKQEEYYKSKGWYFPKTCKICRENRN